MPGKFNYDEIPNFVVTPHRERDIKELQHTDTHLMEGGATTLQRVGRNGLPGDPDTGMPVIPRIPDGSFTLTAQTPLPRRVSDDSLDTPVRVKPKDPYALDDIESRPGTADQDLRA